MTELLLFLTDYSNYFYNEITSPIVYYCDNLEVVKKLQNLNLNREHYTKNHKTKHLDAVLIIQKCIPTTFEAKHVREH